MIPCGRVRPHAPTVQAAAAPPASAASRHTARAAVAAERGGVIGALSSALSALSAIGGQGGQRGAVDSGSRKPSGWVMAPTSPLAMPLRLHRLPPSPDRVPRPLTGGVARCTQGEAMHERSMQGRVLWRSVGARVVRWGGRVWRKLIGNRASRPARTRFCARPEGSGTVVQFVVQPADCSGSNFARSAR